MALFVGEDLVVVVFGATLHCWLFDFQDTILSAQLGSFTHWWQLSVQNYGGPWGAKHNSVTENKSENAASQTTQQTFQERQQTFQKMGTFQEPQRHFTKQITENDDISSNTALNVVFFQLWLWLLISESTFFYTSRPPYKEHHIMKHITGYIFHCNVDGMCWMNETRAANRGLAVLCVAGCSWFRLHSNSRYRSDIQTGPAVLIELIVSELADI